MTNFWNRLLEQIDQDGVAVVVTVTAAEGSAPREAGARMIVTRAGEVFGTIGGGALEYAALDDARRALDGSIAAPIRRDWPLGPDLGQCCGGRVTTLTEVFRSIDRGRISHLAASEPEEQRTQLLLFGAGHVGRALVMALAPLPFDIRWIDSREDAFPPLMVATVTPVRTDHPTHELAAAQSGAFVLIMTHSHPLDLEITAAALQRTELAYVGLIGSATKRARFESRCRGMGIAQDAIARIVCPIGLSGILGKEPVVIAASVAADLLLRREGLRNGVGQGSLTDETLHTTQYMDLT